MTTGSRIAHAMFAALRHGAALAGRLNRAVLAARRSGAEVAPSSPSATWLRGRVAPSLLTRGGAGLAPGAGVVLVAPTAQAAWRDPASQRGDERGTRVTGQLEAPLKLARDAALVAPEPASS